MSQTIQPQPGIMDIALYEPGAAQVAGRSEVLKLSSNENPFGPSPKARDAVIRAAAPLTEDEALEVIVALTQFYRETGHYLERMYKWLKRLGMEPIRATVVEDGEKRRALFDRFVHSQRFAQVDPWAERASRGVAAHEFRPMAEVGFREAAE